MIKYTPIKCEDCAMTYIYRGFIITQNPVTDVNLPALWTAQRVVGSTGKTTGTCFIEHLAITVLGKIDNFWTHQERIERGYEFIVQRAG